MLKIIITNAIFIITPALSLSIIRANPNVIAPLMFPEYQSRSNYLCDNLYSLHRKGKLKTEKQRANIIITIIQHEKAISEPLKLTFSIQIPKYAKTNASAKYLIVSNTKFDPF